VTIDLTTFDALTFDCYGTLIDWNTGVLGALRGILGERGATTIDADLLALYGRFEHEAERPAPDGGHKSYRDVLREVVDRFGERFGFTPTRAHRDALPESIRDWPAFPDTPDALRAIKKRYKLAVLSNIDQDLFALTAPKLGVETRRAGDGAGRRLVQAGPDALRRGVEATRGAARARASCGAESVPRHQTGA
jgi:2-haloacid dehalogenase